LWKNNVDVDSVDNEGLTPMHWACYMASDEAIYYLLAWTKDLNK
jgi:ankyrin repeat protein